MADIMESSKHKDQNLKRIWKKKKGDCRERVRGKFGSHWLNTAKKTVSERNRDQRGRLVCWNGIKCLQLWSSCQLEGHISWGHLTQKVGFTEMLATTQVKRNMAFELQIQLSEPPENCKVLYKFFKLSNSNSNNGTKIQEQIEK